MRKLRLQSIVTPRSLMWSDKGIMEPLTLTLEMWDRVWLRLFVPRRIASDLPGLRARPLWKNQADSDERADSRTWRFAAESGLDKEM